MATILAQKAGVDSAVAKSDDHHDALAADPSIPQFPQGSSYGTTSNIPTGASAFGSSSTGGFGSPGSFGSPTPGFNSTPGGFGSTSFGGSTNSMGSVGTSNMNMSVGNSPVLTGAGSNAALGAEVLVANDKQSEHWINSKWRPAMGWLYMSTCFADFILFPVLWSLLQALNHGQVTSQWQPLTLQGAGLYHIAMGAVLGIAAYGRTKEKVAGAN
jgi:hypothetical protein